MPHRATSIICLVVVVIAAFGCGEEPASLPQPIDEGSVPASTQPVSQVGARTGLNLVVEAPPKTPADNVTCPVSDEQVETEGKKVLYMNKVYGFCCDDCLNTFSSDPDRYVIAQ